MEYLIVAGLAGICPDWWPWGPRRFREREGPIVTLPDPPPGGPDPLPPGVGRWGAWTSVSGLLCGAGGVAAWLALGPGLGGDNSLFAPVVTGFLGGTTAGWLVGSVRDLASPG